MGFLWYANWKCKQRWGRWRVFFFSLSLLQKKRSGEEIIIIKKNNKKSEKVLSWHFIGWGAGGVVVGVVKKKKKVRFHLLMAFSADRWSSPWPNLRASGRCWGRTRLRPQSIQTVTTGSASTLPPPPPPPIITATYWPVICLMGCKGKVSVSIIHSTNHKSHYMISWRVRLTPNAENVQLAAV